MSSSPYVPNQQVLYQAEPASVQSVKQVREKVAGIAGHCQNRPVRVQTVDGHVYEGTVSHIDGRYLYLATHGDQRFFTPFIGYNAILPLVLYELLVITLLL